MNKRKPLVHLESTCTLEFWVAHGVDRVQVPVLKPWDMKGDWTSRSKNLHRLDVKTHLHCKYFNIIKRIKSHYPDIKLYSLIKLPNDNPLYLNIRNSSRP